MAAQGLRAHPYECGAALAAAWCVRGLPFGNSCHAKSFTQVLNRLSATRCCRPVESCHSRHDACCESLRAGPLAFGLKSSRLLRLDAAHGPWRVPVACHSRLDTACRAALVCASLANREANSELVFGGTERREWAPKQYTAPHPSPHRLANNHVGPPLGRYPKSPNVAEAKPPKSRSPVRRAPRHPQNKAGDPLQLQARLAASEMKRAQLEREQPAPKRRGKKGGDDRHRCAPSSRRRGARPSPPRRRRRPPRPPGGGRRPGAAGRVRELRSTRRWPAPLAPPRTLRRAR